MSRGGSSYFCSPSGPPRGVGNPLDGGTARELTVAYARIAELEATQVLGDAAKDPMTRAEAAALEGWVGELHPSGTADRLDALTDRVAELKTEVDAVERSNLDLVILLAEQSARGHKRALEAFRLGKQRPKNPYLGPQYRRWHNPSIGTCGTQCLTWILRCPLCGRTCTPKMSDGGAIVCPAGWIDSDHMGWICNGYCGGEAERSVLSGVQLQLFDAHIEARVTHAETTRES